jgi:hypothetical protein
VLAFGAALVIAGSVLGTATPADAIVVCQKKNRVKLRPDVCKGKETQVVDLSAALEMVGTPGPQGEPGTARAYAEINPRCTSLDIADCDVAGPELVAERTLGFTAVTRATNGTYCLTPAAGIDPATSPAVVSISSLPAASNFAVIARSRQVFVCAPGEYEVLTTIIDDALTFGGTGVSGAGFTVIVP